MKTTDIIRMRLHNQQLTAAGFTTPKEIVGYMGAMQAQEYPLSKWAIGIRLPGSTEKTINRALDKGEILRTHVLRPTWHYVTPEDIHWILSLSAPQQRQAVKFRQKSLELTPAVLNKSNKTIEKALLKGEHLTRKELTAALQQVKIDARNERGGHLLFQAEIDGIICSGIQRGKEVTYALLSERVNGGKSFPREEAMVKLAKRFFTSHGPATAQDFIWWSGLSITDGKNAVEMIKKEFHSIIAGEKTYLLSPNLQIPADKKPSRFLLPPYDEYIIAYADRSAVVTDDAKKKNLFDNGLFRPAIIVNGKAIGNWKRVIKKNKTTAELKYFKKPAKTTEALIKKAVKDYERFVSET
jgi:hypothetical protein